jgi:hypothetical protein
MQNKQFGWLIFLLAGVNIFFMYSLFGDNVQGGALPPRNDIHFQQGIIPPFYAV